ncbi:ABC transporter permease [Nocardioides luti]|uniref:ABC transporter permease n=1 Tax=Nocardioides luti TaxID=2761101 RepID=UPI0031B5882E
MSAPQSAPVAGTHPGPQLDVSGTAPIPFSRLVSVELRKTADTRAGRWLLISMAALTALVMGIQLAVVVVQDLSVGYADFMTATSFSIAILLPVLGILLLTSEWGQRTAMVTFSLEPRRPRVILAKLTVGVLLAFAAVVVALVLGAVANLLYGAFAGVSPTWDLSLLKILSFLLLQVIGILTGFALAALLLNSAAAIVVYMVYSFVFPGLFELGSNLMGWFHDLRPWIDFNAAQNPLIDASMTGEDWAHFAVSGVLWLVLPLSIGLWRVLRAEVK